MGTMVTFFCTRCGAQLEIDPEAAGRPVRCGRCSTVVRTPAAVVADVEDVPFARLAAVAGPLPPPLPPPLPETGPVPIVAVEPAADSGGGGTTLDPFFGMSRDQESFVGGLPLVLPPVLPPPLPTPLSYVPAWPERHERAVWLDQMARRLEDVTAPDEDDPDSMTNCSYCGSTIAPFLKKCPYCRHALWGI